MAAGSRWTQDELRLALHLYMRLPFGQQSQTNAEIQALAQILGRTPGSVAMKLNNFTSLDPVEQARGIRGLVGASQLDREVFLWSREQPEEAAACMEALWLEHVERDMASIAQPAPEAPPEFRGPETEAVASRRVRLGQAFFRRTVLTNYQGRCALTGIRHPSLLRASHIVGWAEDPRYRVDVRNGLLLSALVDAAFDRHLITFDADLCLVVGKALGDDAHSSGLTRRAGQRLSPAHRWEPDPKLLAQHRATFGIREAQAAAGA